MRSARFVLLPIVFVLAVSGAHANGANWSFEVIPPAASTGPGGTTQWTWKAINSSATDALVLDGGNMAWLPSFFLNLPHIADVGLDYVIPPPIPPGDMATGDWFHITWKPTAPIGTHVTGFAFIDAVNDAAVPSEVVQQPIDAIVTPELPPGALGLLSFVPYGLWRLRSLRRRKG